VANSEFYVANYKRLLGLLFSVYCLCVLFFFDDVFTDMLLLCIGIFV